MKRLQFDSDDHSEARDPLTWALASLFAWSARVSSVLLVLGLGTAYLPMGAAASWPSGEEAGSLSTLLLTAGLLILAVAPAAALVVAAYRLAVRRDSQGAALALLVLLVIGLGCLVG